ncbi:MAG: SUMF1/EgtB/PvdO family nonheme iron enzyme [Anaerolineales bacterium]|nr:SUMF1/EgtB/PvdO family nonheme iron enzyme [Anaerolineales bacterium]
MAQTLPDRNEDEPVLEKINVDPFSMEATEVTNAHYRSCVEAGVCEKPKRHRVL